MTSERDLKIALMEAAVRVHGRDITVLRSGEPLDNFFLRCKKFGLMYYYNTSDKSTHAVCEHDLNLGKYN